MSVKTCGATKMQKKLNSFLTMVYFYFSKLCNQHEYREHISSNLAHIDFNEISEILSLTHICSLCMLKMARRLDINGV